MNIFQWVISVTLILAGFYIAVMNWAIVVAWLKSNRQRSGVPFVGGMLAALGIALLPVEWAKSYWWLLFAVDFGCLPGLVFAAIRWSVTRMEGSNSPPRKST